MAQEQTITEMAAKVTTFSGAAWALTLQQWSGVIIGLLGLLLHLWLGRRRDAREEREDARKQLEHEERMSEIHRNPDRRTTGNFG